MTVSLMSSVFLKNVSVKNSFQAQTEKYIKILKNALPKIRIGNALINERFLDGNAEQDELIKELVRNGKAVYKTRRLINYFQKEEEREEIIKRIQESISALLGFWENSEFKFIIGETKNRVSPNNDFYEFFETKITITIK